MTRATVPSTRTAGVGLATLLAISTLVVAEFSGAFNSLFGASGRTVNAVFANTGQLQAGDPVRIDGVDVGQVSRVAINPGARSATVTMTVGQSAGPLYADATAAVRWRTALGGAFVVDLKRGIRATAALGSSTIPETRTTGQVELDDITSVDQGAARAGLQAMPGQLARALKDPRAPARALAMLADISPDLAHGAAALRGTNLDTDLQALVSATAATMHALDTPSGDLQRLLAAASTTLDTTAARQADIRTTLSAAPAALRQTDLTLKRLDATLRLTDPLVAQLRGPADQVAPTVAQLHPVVVGADRLLRSAVPLLHALRPAVASLANAGAPAISLLTGLKPSLARLDGTTLPSFNQTDPQTAHTTAQMVGPTFAGLGPGAGGQEDTNGHFIRFPITIGSGSFYLPCQIFAGDPQVHMLQCQSLEQALSTLFSYDPLKPAPSFTGGSVR